MDITKIIETLPAELKNSVVEFQQGRIKREGELIPCIRVLFERDTPTDLFKNIKSKRYLGSGVAQYKYAPEIKYPYIYIKE